MYARVVMVLLMFNVFASLEAKQKSKISVEIAKLYEKIGRNLAEVKRKAPVCATKIGSVLDDVDRLYKATSTSLRQDSATMKELETRTIESTVLQKELFSAKQESEDLKQTIQKAESRTLALSKELDEHRKQLLVLKEQNILLAKKSAAPPQDLVADEMSKLDKQLATGDQKSPVQGSKKVAMQNQYNLNQNLSLTSTSEPSSPR